MCRPNEPALFGALALVCLHFVDPPPPYCTSTQAEIFSGMIPQPEGRALIEAMSGSSDPTQGALVPMNCNKKLGIGSSNQQCHAAAKADRDIVDGLTLVRGQGTGRAGLRRRGGGGGRAALMPCMLR